MARIVKEGQRGYDEHAELKIEFTHDQGRKTLAMTGDRIERFLERFLSLATYPLDTHKWKSQRCPEGYVLHESDMKEVSEVCSPVAL